MLDELEIILAAVLAGDEKACLQDIPVLSRKEERKLAKLIDAGERAKRKLAASNARLLFSIASWYQRKFPQIDFMDILQEGYLGLLRALKDFEYRMGNKFSTYAIWWIKQKIRRLISKELRIPKTTSLSAPAGKEQAEGGDVIGSLLEQEGEPLVIDFADKTFLKAAIEKILAELPEEERELLELRFGLNGCPQFSVKEIAKKYETRVWIIRQKITKILRNLERKHKKLLRKLEQESA